MTISFRCDPPLSLKRSSHTSLKEMERHFKCSRATCRLSLLSVHNIPSTSIDQGALPISGTVFEQSKKNAWNSLLSTGGGWVSKLKDLRKLGNFAVARHGLFTEVLKRCLLLFILRDNCEMIWLDSNFLRLSLMAQMSHHHQWGTDFAQGKAYIGAY